MTDILQPPFAFADTEQYSIADLTGIIRTGELEKEAAVIPRQRDAAEFMVKCAVFEYWARQNRDKNE